MALYEPTYQLDPFVKFDPETVEDIIKEILNNELKSFQYEDDLSVKTKCLQLSDTLKKAVQELNFDRYKIIAVVTMGLKRHQTVLMVHSFLWDHHRDNFASYNFENSQIFCNAVVYGVYLD